MYKSDDNKYNSIVFEGVENDTVYYLLLAYQNSGEWMNSTTSFAYLFVEDSGEFNVSPVEQTNEQAVYTSIHEGWELIKGDKSIFPTFLYTYKFRKRV